LRGNPLAELEITRSDLALFQMWSYLLPPLTQSACRSKAARRVRVLNADLCVLEDTDFTRVYGKSPSWRVGEDESGDGDVASASPPAIPQPVKPAAQTSQRARSPFTWTMLILAIVVIAVVMIGVISTISWRHQQLRRKVKNLLARNSHMRTSSFNGDLLRAVRLEGEVVATRFDADDIKILHLLSKHGHCLLFLGAMRDFQNDTNDVLTVAPTRPMDESDRCSTTVSLPDLQAFGQHQLVMLKRIVPEHCNDSSAPLRRFVQEIQLLSQLDHPKVLALRGVCWNTLADVTMVLEYAANGDLRTLLRVDSDRVAKRGPQSTRLCWAEPTRSLHMDDIPSKCSIAVDVAEALVYLHSSAPPVLHCGLQARHVFLSDRYEAKLSNIGAPLDVTTTAALDSVAWMAPEILRGERYTEKADMYAFGILLTELATSATPFDGLASAAIVVRVAHDHERPSLEDATDCPDLIVHFAQRCMRADASERPSALDAHRELLAVRRILRSDLDLI
jgi:serine/threonine protein kinase